MTAVDQTRWSLAWRERPPEEAAHFNPAFCGELLARTTGDYAKVRGTALPLALTFLVLPLTLPPPLRRVLPGRADTAFASWAGDNADVLTTVPERVMRLRPVTRESLLFATQVSALAVSGEGVAAGPSPFRLTAKSAATTGETDDIRRAAGLLGRWFAAQGSAAAILQTMGVRV